MPRAPHKEPQVQVQVITANLLREGHVVWLTPDATWSRDLAAAHCFDDAEVAEAALAAAVAETGTVVGAYLAPMRPTPDGPEPIHFREAFRCAGPSPRAFQT